MERPGVARSGRERHVLAQVAEARKQSVIAKAFGIVAIVGAVFFVGVLAIAALAGFGGIELYSGLFAMLAGITAMLLLLSARRAQASARAGMQEAIGLVAVDVMRAKGALSASELAEQLGLSITEAQAALDRLPARDELHVESVVDERSIDGQVRYRISASAAVVGQERALALDELADDERRAFDAKLQQAIDQNKRMESK